MRKVGQLLTFGLILAMMPSSIAQAQFGFGLFGPSRSPNNPSGGRNSVGQTTRTDPNERSRPNGVNPFGIFQTILEAQPNQGPRQLSPREDFEQAFYGGTPAQAVEKFEQLQRRTFADQLEIQIPDGFLSAESIARQLGILSRLTGRRTAVLYLANLERTDQIGRMLVLPQTQPLAGTGTPVASRGTIPFSLAQSTQSPVIRQIAADVNPKQFHTVAAQFRRQISDPTLVESLGYRSSAQQLYGWLVAPLASQLRAHQIDTVLFSLDDGLRSLPVAALHDGQRFLIETHSVALIPSFGLTDSGLRSHLIQKPLLAMGISKEHQGLSALPAVPLELSALSQRWQAHQAITLDESSTVKNLRDLNRQRHYGVIHLATHAQFNPGDINNSYIQLWNERLKLKKLNQLARELSWGQAPAVELLVMSACETALGSREAELGFAGAALLAEVKSTAASLWRVNDQGTLGLMNEFYAALQTSPTKAEALRTAQLAMLREEIFIQAGQLRSRGTQGMDLPLEAGLAGDLNFRHPYYWSGYTIVGNWN
ncbi:CHAT domain-containing protein [Lyngbya confervoides]|uniref:CHAT domain-containing protein n=1 Tax=Lyngbya confervoides BDU141951 TaxID=1574623 RepID=A0ABD4T7P2_9CYAN|nr:CHAT domain-containing protein [Lyngbya confervoides]MCM1984539.1 CHAT domain-containing protein [Lyngbya confervoides BDU141951]